MSDHVKVIVQLYKDGQGVVDQVVASPEVDLSEMSDKTAMYVGYQEANLVIAKKAGLGTQEIFEILMSRTNRIMKEAMGEANDADASE